MLTVKVCAEMSATPTTAAPVSNCIGAPPARNVTLVWAGQKVSGTHCTTLSSTQSNRPVTFVGDVILIVCSAPARSAIGLAKLTTTGCPTPTTSPGPGWTPATVKASDGDRTAAMPALPDPAIAIAAPTTAASTYRAALRTVSIPFETVRPGKYQSSSPASTHPGTGCLTTDIGDRDRIVSSGLIAHCHG